jgi:hypothetical protein
MTAGLSKWAQPPAPPLTLQETNQRLHDLSRELERQHEQELQGLLAEQQRVSLAYELRYAAAVTASDKGSEDRRKAEATAAMGETYLDDDPATDLATRKAVVDMRVRAQREYAHNLRAEINAMQTLSANLRAEAGLAGGIRP